MKTESRVTGLRVFWGILDSIQCLLKPIHSLHDVFDLVELLDVMIKLHNPNSVAFLFRICQ